MLLVPQLLCLAVAMLALSAQLTKAAKTRDPFYIISHMANSRASLDWSVREGANAIEVDIQFDKHGNPYEFEHRGVCDCRCTVSNHICQVLRKKCSGRDAKNNAAEHLRHLARLSGVALVIMDGKVDAKWGGRLRTAGQRIVDLLERNLFAHGYRGKVVISAGKINCFDYVYSAALAAGRTGNSHRYYFSFDQESNNYKDVAAMLSRFTQRRVFGTGITSCMPGNYETGIRQAVRGVGSGQVGMSYIWTLDKESSMRSYIDMGVHGIITNRPRLLRNLAQSMGLRLATPQNDIPVARSFVPSPHKCDCDYHKGGCTISFPPPQGRACRCKYKGAWTCGGSVVNCNKSSNTCRNPDASRDACRLGGGDCGGYR